MTPRTNTTVVESAEDLAVYVNVFDQLRSAAMSPEETAEFIEQLLSSYPNEQEEKES